MLKRNIFFSGKQELMEGTQQTFPEREFKVSYLGRRKMI